MSFQGGDGYQYFMNHDLAYASISRILEFCLIDEIHDKLWRLLNIFTTIRKENCMSKISLQ